MKKFVIFSLLFLTSLFLYGQNDIADSFSGGTGAGILNAAEEFRLGVNAFNRFAYNEAILSFERALSFRPGEAVILDWLGKAYYKSGLEETALRQWNAALDVYGKNSGVGMLLASRIETVANRRFLFPLADDGVRYVAQGRFPGKYENTVLYRQPTSILPNNDGSVWAVAYGSNELVKIDVNGIIKDRKRGPLNGFDRPYDMVRGIDGRYYVSEYRGGRISILNSNGDWQAYIGAKGLADGQLLGPQNMTIDEDGYLYVVDYGNKRISKFDPDGAFIISFGHRDSSFPGFLSPTGIAACNGRIYAADNLQKAIYMFDPNGGYIGRLTRTEGSAENLISPESLRFVSNGKNSEGFILAADANRVLAINPDSAIVRELGLSGNEKARVTCADMDSNGNILAANFDENEITVMTRFDDLASGLFVQIRNVYAERFPAVTVEFTVEDRMRRPIAGLDTNNFLLTEDGLEAAEQVFLQPGYRRQGTDISLLVERSQAAANMRDDLTAAARDIESTLQEMEGAKIVSVVSASELPRREQHEVSLENAVRGSIDSFSSKWRFDLGLRLAATDLLAANPKRSVVYIGSGGMGDLSFEQYSLSELAAYLANNNIVFNAVILGGGIISPTIEYLCEQSGGRAMRLYNPRGIGELIKSTEEIRSPLYSFSFTSKLPPDFGRAWLPLEIEVYLMERSGRDNIGYFSPLE